MTKISATVLTFNEEKRIEACLRSIRDVADEIIVVDSNSTDSTLDICKRYGCRISRRHLAGFGAQRQYATSLTSHNYVLSIDADEELSPALRQSLLEFKNGTPAHRVYAVSRLNYYCGYAVRHCGWYPDVQIRLFDKRFANWNLRDVHERVIFRDSVRPEMLRGDLLHNRCDTPQEYDDTLSRQSALRSKVLAAGNRRITSMSPLLYGLRAFMHVYLRRSGLLDGSVGLAISRHIARAERLAWAGALQMHRDTSSPMPLSSEP